MNQIENSMLIIGALVELVPVPPQEQAEDPYLAGLASAVSDILAARPDLLEVLQHSKAYYELSEHFLRKNEAFDEATDAVEQAIFDALPQELRNRFDEVTGLEVFREFMVMDLKFFVPKVVESTLERT